MCQYFHQGRFYDLLPTGSFRDLLPSIARYLVLVEVTGAAVCDRISAGCASICSDDHIPDVFLSILLKASLASS